jgi:putative membrane protein
MNPVVWAFALVAAAVHVLAFAWETLLFRRPGVHRGVFAIDSADVPPVLLWAFNVGFYNLFLACGTVAGLVAWSAGAEQAGRALVLYTCAFMALAGVALFASDRMALSRPRGTGVGGALAQSLPPLVALVAALL